MATRITIDATDTEITVHVTDDTGRDETAKCPRYPRPGSEDYVHIVDKLDVFMYTHGV